MEGGSMVNIQGRELPYFHAVYDIRSDCPWLRIPKSFVHAHLHGDRSRCAWLSLEGLEGRSWKCDVKYNGDHCLISKGWVQFFTDISDIHAALYFIFQYGGHEMQFTVTRYDMDGNLITAVARKGLLEYPGCVDGQAEMHHELLYHVWNNACSPLVLPNGRFADGLKENGVPGTYNLKLETHPTVNWEVTVEVHANSLLRVTNGWKAFAMETEINASTCVRFKLVNKNTLLAIIFSATNGEVILPSFISSKTVSQYVPTTSHLAASVLQTRVCQGDNKTITWLHEFWFSLGDTYSLEQLRLYRTFVSTLQDDHGTIPHEFIQRYLHTSDKSFTIQSMEDMGTSSITIFVISELSYIALSSSDMQRWKKNLSGFWTANCN